MLELVPWKSSPVNGLSSWARWHPNHPTQVIPHKTDAATRKQQACRLRFLPKTRKTGYIASMNTKAHSISLLGLCLVLAIGCARTPLTADANSESNQQTAKSPADDAASVDALKALGVKLQTDGNGNVTSADFRDTAVSDDDLKNLAGLKSIRNLDLRGCEVTNAGMASLEGLTTLKALRFSGKSGKTDVTDASMPVFGKLTNLKVLALDFLKFAASADGISELSNLKNLEELYIGNTLVDDDSLQVVATHFPKLKKLRVAASQVSDEGAKHIASLSNLVELDISENSLLYDTGLEHLKAMKQLKKLNCYRLQITDDGVAHLAGLTNMEWLNLDNIGYLSDDGLPYIKDMSKLGFLHIGSNAGITDSGLEHLKPLTNLKDLKVTRTTVSEEGAAELKKTLKETEIQVKYIEGQ